MANKKVTQLPENKTPTDDDLLYMVDSPSGEATSQSVSIENVIGLVPDAEPPLGNPAVDDYILSSTADGVRSWIPDIGALEDAPENGSQYGRQDADWTEITPASVGAEATGTASALVDAHAAAIYSEAHPLPTVPNYTDAGINAAMQALADAGIIIYDPPPVSDYIFNDETIHTLTGVAGDSVWYSNVIVRQPGQVVLFDTTITDVAQTIEFGFDTNQAGSIDANALRITGGDLKPTDSGTVGPDVAYPTSGTPYQLGVILRAAGAFYMQGDMLLAIHGTDTSTPVYAGFANTSATGTVDGARAPVDLWAPTPIAADTGTSVDVAGTYYTDGGDITDPIEQGGDGETWNGATWSNGVDGAKNAPGLGESRFPDSDMEDAGTTGWGSTGVVATFEKSTEQAAGGSQSLKVGVSAASAGLEALPAGGSRFSPGDWFATSTDVFASSGTSVNLYQSNGIAGVISKTISCESVWAIASSVARASGSYTNTYIRSITATDVFYVDNFYQRLIPTADLFRSITNGTTPFIYTEVEGTLGETVQAGSVLMLDDKDDPQNFVIVYHDGTSVIADKCVAGVYTNLFTVGAAEVPGVLPTASTRDNGDGTAQLLVWYDGAFIAEQEIPDAGIVANTLYGEFSTSDTNRISHFTVYNTGGHEIPGA